MRDHEHQSAHAWRQAAQVQPEGGAPGLLRERHLVPWAGELVVEQEVTVVLQPNGNLFYKSLLFRSSKFKKIYETPCDLLCRILYLGDPVNSFEQTANVFDRPTVMIFKKTEK